MKSWTANLTRSAILAGFVIAAIYSNASAQDVPPPEGFELSTYVTDLSEPTAIAPAPDGRLFVAERRGTIRVVSPNGDTGRLEPEPFATFEVYTGGECGLLGLAFDPDFETNGHLFAFITASASEQRIVRLTDVGGVAADETVIRGNLPTNGGVHNGGCIRVGPDGKLYFSIGDNGDAASSDTITTLAGKIGRINRDGSIPDDNPFVTPTGTRRAVFASGFRNPFRFCFASDGRLFVMDVGSSGDQRYEEINLVEAGKDYGWPSVEGPTQESGTESNGVDPIFAYRDEGAAIAGCAVYESAQFPDEYHGSLFHLDHTSGALFRVTLKEREVETHERFFETSGGVVDLAVGAEGSLYFTRLFNGDIQRVTYPAGLSSDPNDPDGNGNGSNDPDPGDTSPPTRLCGAGAMAQIWLGLCLAYAWRLHGRNIFQVRRFHQPR